MNAYIKNNGSMYKQIIYKVFADKSSIALDGNRTNPKYFIIKLHLVYHTPLKNTNL